MTLVIALIGKKSIWLATDRRLSNSLRQWDTAVKTIALAGIDGDALLGYAGLGATGRQVEPSTWMGDLLVGYGGLTVEQALGVIAEAMKVDMPSQLRKMPGRKIHAVLAPSLIKGKPQLYSISIDLGHSDAESRFIFTRYVRSESGNSDPRIGIAGSGANYLPPARLWYRDLFRLLIAHEKGQVSAEAIADKLASLINGVSGKDKFVSSDCIVQWRSDTGGAQFYSHGARIDPDVQIPTVGNGMNVNAIVGAMLPFLQAGFAAARRGEIPEIDTAGIQAELNKMALIPKTKLE